MILQRSLTNFSLICHMQTYPDLQPLYDAARSYLEIPQRINLLNTRVEVSIFCVVCVMNTDLHEQQVLQDMLQLLKETVSSRHAERLETIVIWLIVVEIGKERLIANVIAS